MYRLRLVRMGDADHRLYLTLHHIIFDGMSLYHVLLPELQKLYAAYANNESALLPDLPIQYSDYAAWQRSAIKEITERDLPFWSKICRDLPALDLPLDRPRPSTQTYAGATESLHVSTETSATLKTIAEHQGATPFTMMVATFMALLHSYSGQEEIVIGGVSSGRHHSETMGLLGCFLNTIPIRCAFSKDNSFIDLLGHVRTATLSALSHDQVPFELLVQNFAQGRDPSRAPLVQALVVVEPPLEPLGSEWEFSYMDAHTGTSKFDLELGLDDRPEGLTGRFIYNSDLFDHSTILQLKGRWLQLLDRVAADPKQRLSDLVKSVSALTEQPQSYPLPEWNATATDYPRDKTVAQVFEDQVTKQPSAAALIFGSDQVSYSELNRRANQLANRLQKLGVTRDMPIGIGMERSLEMVTTLLAILKAGGAYVPLDPDYPDARLALIIKQTAMPLIVTKSHLANRFVATNGPRVVSLDTEKINDESDANSPNQSHPDDLAYVMYTSGSTGTPKGVAIPNRAVVRLVKNTNYATFSPDETFLQLAPLSFDASTFEIWGPLLNGGELVIMSPTPPSLEDIGKAIRQHKVTTLWLTAGLFNAIVDERIDDLRPLRQLLAGGDVLSVTHVKKAVQTLKQTRLINGYGPTESTTFACCHTIDPLASLESSIPIGEPIANTTAYILDSALHPVPIGVTGELFIGGDGLARGYWHNDSLTGEKFVSDPFNANPGTRLYRTGDMARWRNDGIIEFLGRSDNQIKLRGFRIEPGEIEFALKQQHGVLDAAVIMREDVPGNRRLVGYVVCEEEASRQFNEENILAVLRKSLPDYMTPSVILNLQAMPRTQNGKLDRDALPAPESSPARSERQFVSPKTTLENQLAALWATVLGIDCVSVTDNFFDLGGHSLSGLRLINRLRETIGKSVPLTAIFEAPTVRQMAELLEKQSSGERSASPASRELQPVVPVNRESRRRQRRS